MPVEQSPGGRRPDSSGRRRVGQGAAEPSLRAHAAADAPCPPPQQSWTRRAADLLRLEGSGNAPWPTLRCKVGPGDDRRGRRLRWLAALALSTAAWLPGPARGDLQLCNRTSYVVETAIGIEDKGAAATRGWFRLDPGQCRPVMQGKVEAERVYVHARALDLYGVSPMPQAGHAQLCIAEDAFLIAGARSCGGRGQRLARFTEVKPAETSDGLTASLAEDADYEPAQARLAGIQRLLVVAGYDANPIDGVEGKKTEAALAQFLKERRLGADAANADGFFDTLVAAVKQVDGGGFAWCNETPHTVMAAVGVEEKTGTVTRGWYRVEPGKCVKPDVSGSPRRLYSFAEAVDADGQVVKRADKPLAWGGTTQLCTRDVKFELSDHKDCAGKGLTVSGFAVVDLAGRTGATVRFRE